MSKIIKLLGIMLSFVNCSYLRTTNSYLRVPQPMMYELPIHDINNFLIAKSNFCSDHSPFILNVLKNDITLLSNQLMTVTSSSESMTWTYNLDLSELDGNISITVSAVGIYGNQYSGSTSISLPSSMHTWTKI